MPENNRLQPIDPAALDAGQRELYEAITNGPRRAPGAGPAGVDPSGRMRGPFNAMLLSPTVGDALQSLGAAIRFQSTLPDRSREIASLVVAQIRNIAFEWKAHAPAAKAGGVTDAEIESIANGKPALLDPSEQLVAELAATLTTEGRIDDARYAHAVGVLGEAWLFELVTLVGYYGLLGILLDAFGYLD